MNAEVPDPPGFPVRLVRASNFMQLSLLKAAHANTAGAAQQEIRGPLRSLQREGGEAV
jgi:hypothetical protein